MKKKQRQFLAGIVDIGSHSVRLDLFEVAGEKHRLLENLIRPLNLGIDVFRHGRVSVPTLNQLVLIMESFRRKLDEYAVTSVRVVATSAIREAFNRELVISRVRHDTGMEIEILEAQEEARITFLALRAELAERIDFAQSSGIAFIVGTGSLIVVYFENGLLRFSEAVTVGTVRIVDELGLTAFNSERVIEILNSVAIGQRIRESSGFDPERALLVIGIGAGIRLLTREARSGGRGGPLLLAPEKARQLARAAIEADPAELAAAYSIPDHLAMSFAPCGNMVEYFLDEFNCSHFICPELTTRTALLAELIRQNRGEEPDPFLADMTASAENIAEKYRFDRDHAESVTTAALQIYDKLRRYYDFAPRSRIWLQIAAMLHDIGRYVDIQGHHKHSYYLIMNSQLPGLSPAEKRIVATVARYHRNAGPKPSHAEYVALSADEKVSVLKLAAILRVADALDRTHSHRLRKMKLKIRGDELLIQVPDADDFGLEKIYLELKGNLFREVFGLRPEIAPVMEKL